MAIAFDNTTLSARSSAGASSFTFSHTTSGSDRFLIVSVTTFNFSSGTPSPTVTYNGTSMTPIAQNVVAFNVNNWRHHSYYLVNPDTGANNVVVTATSGTGLFECNANSYTGVDQTSPILDSGTASSLSGGTMQVSLTTADDGWWFISGANVDANWTAGANTSQIRQNRSIIGSADSNGDITAQTGNAQMSHGGSRGYGGAAVAFKESVGGGVARRIFNIS